MNFRRQPLVFAFAMLAIPASLLALNGDVNLDGIVTKADVDVLSNFLVGNSAVIPSTVNADVNHDTRLDANDALVLLQYVNGLRAPLPLENSCRTAPSNQVGWWPGDGNANDIVGGNHGTLSRGATFTPGVVGQAFSFNGSGAMVSIPDSPLLNIRQNLTVASWFKLTGIPVDFPVIMAKGQTNAQYLIFVLATAGAPSGTGNVCFRVNLGPDNAPGFNTSAACSVTRVNFGTALHVAGTYDGTSVKIYINGVLESSVPAPGRIAFYPHPLTIGVGGYAGGVTANFVQGSIDEVQIYNRLLAGVEINSLFAAGSAGQCKPVTDRPATLSIETSSPVISGFVATSTMTVDTGSRMLGAQDFLINFDTNVVALQGVGAAAAQFQNSFYSNSSSLSQGRLHILALNGASAQAPVGAVSVATMTFVAAGPRQPSSFNAQVNVIVDTQPVSYGPAAVSPSHFIVVPASEVDNKPPRTSLIVGSPAFGQNPIFVSTQTFLSLDAVDDRFIVGDASGVGVKDTRITSGSELFSLYSGPFTLTTEGSHTIQFFSRDNLLNTEATVSKVVVVDVTPPESFLEIGTPKVTSSDGSLILHSQTPLRIVATDPVSNDVASGVASVSVSLDRAAFVPSTGSFTLATEGPHVVKWFATDNVGNAEAIQSTSVLIDITPPVSSLQVGSATYTLSGEIYLSSITPVGIISVDPLASVATSFFAFDGEAFQELIGNYLPLTFSTGTHTVAIYSVDRLGNSEPTTSFTLRLPTDVIPPVTEIVFSPQSFVEVSGEVYLSTRTQISFVAQDAESGVAFTQFSIDGGVIQQFISSFTLPEGVHTILFQSQDQIGNLEDAQTRTVRVDATAPASLLSIGLPQLQVNGKRFVNGQTTFSLVSADPISQGVASGIKTTWVGIHAGPFDVAPSTFTLSNIPDGPVTVRFYSEDNVFNAEAVQSIYAALDTTAPVTSIAVTTPSFVSPDGTLFIKTGGRVSLSAVDPLAGGQAVGVAFTQFSVDNAAFQNFVSPITLPAGAHTIRAFSEDALGNRESQRTFAVRVDATPPVSTLVVGEPKKNLILGITLIGPTTPLSISAIDPLTNGVSSGVKEHWVAIDAQPFQRVNGNFFIPATRDGIHIVRYYSRDNVLNTETARLAIVIVLSPYRGLPKGFSFGAGHAMGAPGAVGTAADSLSDVQPAPVIVEGDSAVSYHLEFAPGWNSQSGFTPISNEWELLDPEAATNGGSAQTPTQLFTVRLRASDTDGHTDIDAANIVGDMAPAFNNIQVFGAPDLSPSLALRDMFVFPNPARAGDKPTIHVEVGIADQVTLKIYDAAGRQVHETILTQTPSLIDSGNGTRYAYEYLWDGDIPSGVYFYSIEAKKAGASTINAKGKFGVVR